MNKALSSSDDESPTMAVGHIPAPADLYRRYSCELQEFLLALLRDRADADDVLQQVFLRLLEGWESFQLATARGWLFTVAYHEAMAVRRRRNLDAAAMATLWARPVWQAYQSTARPEEEFARKEDMEAVQTAMGNLPAAQQEVVQRRMYQAQTFAAIAHDLGCSVNTVLTRMRLALTKLRDRLEE